MIEPDKTSKKAFEITKNVRSKMENWEIGPPCLHPGHNLPGHMVIPDGGYTHICPCCGKEQHIRTNRVFM